MFHLSSWLQHRIIASCNSDLQPQAREQLPVHQQELQQVQQPLFSGKVA
jgi:hypothetical protein